VSRAVRILGVDVDPVTLEEAADRITDAIDARHGHGGPVFQVATVNPEFVMLARRDPAFRRALQQCALRVADGIGVAMASRILGQPLPGRVPGAELVERVCEAAARRGDRVFLLGGAPGVAEAAAAALHARYPALAVAGAFAGDATEAGDADTLAAVSRARADIVLVAYGAPAQELWSERNLAASGATVAIGVGGTFDYLAGAVRRAPGWIRGIGLEWLYRLVRQPWRARRQVALWVFLGLVLRARVLGA